MLAINVKYKYVLRSINIIPFGTNKKKKRIDTKTDPKRFPY